jgi:hypothetical protein
LVAAICPAASSSTRRVPLGATRIRHGGTRSAKPTIRIWRFRNTTSIVHRMPSV